MIYLLFLLISGVCVASEPEGSFVMCPRDDDRMVEPVFEPSYLPDPEPLPDIFKKKKKQLKRKMSVSEVFFGDQCATLGKRIENIQQVENIKVPCCEDIGSLPPPKITPISYVQYGGYAVVVFTAIAVFKFIWSYGWLKR